jgi:succinate dehydrogenase flavin-adding protein (antitoxin of CptAB toxin-antitoxin module)
MLGEAEMKRLRWRCTHRAHRELDWLLEHFLDRHFPNLSPEQETAFVILAEKEDVDLWPMVMGRHECRDPVQARILDMLRKIRAD